MNEMLKRGVFALLTVCLFGGLVMGCSDDDPNYENVQPPTVEVAPNTLSGVITAISGEPISGATVTLGTESVKTDSKGMYGFSDIKVGTYTVKAEADGKVSKEGEVTVEATGKSQNLVWNAVLASVVKAEVIVSTTEDTEGNTETEALENNDMAIVDVEATVPAAAVVDEAGATVEEVEIIITPLYSADEVKTKSVKTRAAEDLLLVGSSLTASKSGVKLSKPVDLGFQVDDEVAQNVDVKKYVNGEWINASYRTENGKVIIEADELTAYGLFLGVSFSASNGSEAIVFNQSEWNNLYGASAMEAGSATYSYKVGTEIQMTGTSVLTALLIEKLAQRYGATVSTVNGSYPLNVSLPIGTALTLSGVQSKQSVSASAKGKTVSGTHYGTVTIAATTYNRQHTGGGS